MSKGKLVAACLLWVMILGVGVLTWKLIFRPAVEQAESAEQAAQAAAEADEARRRLQQSSSDSRYKQTVDFQLDSFSGYAVLRSDNFRTQLSKAGIRLNLKDDGADYTARLAALKNGDAQLACFTIDALIKTSAEMNDMPATIIAVIDETTGADAIVAYKEKIPNVDALNDPNTRFILTPNSPSETLTRVVMSRFDLDQLGTRPFTEVGDASEVFTKYKNSKPADLHAYVLWEPYVSQMLANPAMHVVVDSSQFPATIVDVIVASRDFVLKKPDVMEDFVKAYLTSVYEFRDRSNMLQLIQADAKASDSPLTAEQAEKLVDGVWWKNTQENLAHFGLLNDKSLPYLEDVIANLIDVLQTTGGIQRDPSAGKANLWFYSKVLENIRDFHPGDQIETVRDTRLPPLTEQQWGQLSSVGVANVPKLVFPRGTATLTARSKSTLDKLASDLNATRLYVAIVGDASRRGNIEQNQQIAIRRAQVAQDYLISRGVDKNRIRAVGSEPSGNTSVTFKLGQLPY